MFKWFKVLKKLSVQDDVIAETEHKIFVLNTTLEELERKSQDIVHDNAALERKICENLEKYKNIIEELKKTNEEQVKNNENCRVEMSEILNAIEKYFKTFEEKSQDVSETALNRLTQINEMVQSYEGHVKELGSKLTELGNLIAEFQR